METDTDKIKGHKSALKRLSSIAIRIIVAAVILYFIISLVKWENVLIAYRVADSRFILAVDFYYF